MRGIGCECLRVFDRVVGEEVSVGELGDRRRKGGVPMQDVGGFCPKDGGAHRI